MRSRTSFAFCGLVRWNFASARNSRIFSAAILAMIFVLQNFYFAAPCGGSSGHSLLPEIGPDYLGFAEDSAALAEWPLNVRVAENSPSLWPTMFSVT